MDIIEQHTTNAKRHPWELARFEVLFSLLEKALPPTSESKIIVDIGCGDCFFAEELLARRTDVTLIGIDTAYSEDRRKEKMAAVHNQRFQLFTSLSEAQSFLNGPAHLVLLLDVLEHIEKDAAFLHQLATAPFFQPKTQLLISVPAFNSLFTRHDHFLNHFRRYNLEQLRRVVQKAGLVPAASGFFFASLLPLRWFQKLKEKAGWKNQPSGIGQWKAPAFATQLFKSYLLADFKFSKTLGKIGIRLPGLSAYCLCKKPVL